MPRLAALVLGFFAAAACEAAACQSAPPFDAPAMVAAATRSDDAGRPVAPVMVNGQGPFRFIIDTGANRSVLSGALARRLGLQSTSQGEVHSIDGVEIAPFVHVESLAMGATRLSQGATPVLDGPMLAGEHGLLGVDGMAGRVLYVDFERRCAEIYDARAARPLPGWTTISGRMRFGSLMVAQGEIQGVRVNVLIDTGANVSLANQRFREALYRVRASRIDWKGDRAFTYGRPIVLEETIWTPSLHIGRLRVSGVTAQVGDFHIFNLWGLNDEPTLLIGMDVLARSRAMAIDYERGLIHFRERPRGVW